MTGTALGKQIESHYANDPRMWIIRCNVNKRSKFIKGLPNGFSDFLVLLKSGKAIFIETKSKDETQKPDQEKFQHRVIKLGFPYIIARTLADVEAAIICS